MLLAYGMIDTVCMRVWANHHLLHCANKKKYPAALRELENTDLRELKNNSNFLACAMIIRHAYGTYSRYRRGAFLTFMNISG